jgi:hypothetical protein
MLESKYGIWHLLKFKCSFISKCCSPLVPYEIKDVDKTSLPHSRIISQKHLAEPLYQFVSMQFGSKVEGFEATRWERYCHGAAAETLPPTRCTFINHV